MKKLLSIMLAVAMLVTLFVPMTAFAATASQKDIELTLPTTPGEFYLWEAEDHTEDHLYCSVYGQEVIRDTTYSMVNGSIVADAESQASGGGTYYAMTNAAGGYAGVIFRVTVPQTTTYTVEVVTTTTNQSPFFHYKTAVLDFSDESVQKEELGWYFDEAGQYPAIKYTYTMTYEASSPRAYAQIAVPQNGANKCILDYIKFTVPGGEEEPEEPVVPEEPTGEEVLYKLEPEDHVEEFTAYNNTGIWYPSGSPNVGTTTYTGGIADAESQASGSTVYHGSIAANSVNLKFIVPVQETKEYTFEIVASAGASSEWIVHDTVKNASGGTEYPYILQRTAEADESAEALGWSFDAAGNFPAYKYTCTYTLTAGEHDLYFYIPKRAEGTAAFALDYIKIYVPGEEEPDTPVVPDEPADEVLYQLEPEDHVEEFGSYNNTSVWYPSGSPNVGTTTYTGGIADAESQASGSTVYHGSIAANSVNLKFIVPVQETKEYTFEIVASGGGTSSEWIVHDTVKNASGGTEYPYILQRTAEADESAEALGWSFDAAGNFPAYKYTCTYTLTAGEHELYFYIPKRAEGTAAFALDYIKIYIPAEEPPVVLEDAVAVSGTTVSGNVYYDAAVSGKLIVAAYAGKELVGCANFVDVTSQTEAEISLVCTAAPDTVKVMVWSDMSTLAPVAPLKVFTFSN